jgi:hypothetical protein
MLHGGQSAFHAVAAFEKIIGDKQYDWVVGALQTAAKNTRFFTRMVVDVVERDANAAKLLFDGFGQFGIVVGVSKNNPVHGLTDVIKSVFGFCVLISF